MADNYLNYAPGLQGPIEDGFDITPDDNNDVTRVTRSIMVTGAGDVRVTLKRGSTVTLPELQPGVLYPIRAARVHATGTSATGIVGLD